MPIVVACVCGKRLKAEDRFAGRRVVCPNCGQHLTLPTPSPAPQAAVGQSEPPVPQQPAQPERQPSPPPQQSPAEADGFCAICQTSLHAGEPRASCDSCQAVYHHEFWVEYQGCAIYGGDGVPPTEKLQDIEIPVSYWGREHKPCPSCSREIQAAALRCRFCGATFASAKPQEQSEYFEQQDLKQKLPELRKTVVILFILAVIPCLAPLAAIISLIWTSMNRENLKALSGIHYGLSKLTVVVAFGQTIVIAVVLFFYMGFGPG